MSHDGLIADNEGVNKQLEAILEGIFKFPHQQDDVKAYPPKGSWVLWDTTARWRNQVVLVNSEEGFSTNHNIKMFKEEGVNKDQQDESWRK